MVFILIEDMPATPGIYLRDVLFKFFIGHFLPRLAGAERFELPKSRNQSPLPYRLAMPLYSKKFSRRADINNMTND